ncbi:hypothetical protein F503_05822 [Ophiostoma piceae UAMH 11346]|uniref:Uncharacterized protein n=1 Tax=Ophiostoma piceae (strain UAMH 11346) TaxID=1262450 RepID=S3CCV2_OPHP1|nr:hypothetical protein F503_05822 [Ophiostoma piceae UAMH 11346]
MAPDQAPETRENTPVAESDSSSMPEGIANMAQNTSTMAQDTSTAAAGHHMAARPGELSAVTAMQDPDLTIHELSIPATHPTFEAPVTETEVYLSDNDTMDPDTPMPNVDHEELPVLVFPFSMSAIYQPPRSMVASRTQEERRISRGVHLQPNGTVIGSFMATDLVRSDPPLLLPGCGGHAWSLSGYNTAGARDSVSSLEMFGRTSECSDGSS